jgi:hypothetical protein
MPRRPKPGEIYELLPLPKLVLMALGALPRRTPLPYDLMRDLLEKRYGQTVTSTQLSVAIANARASRSKAYRTLPAPALSENGHAARGWVTRSDWPLYERIIPIEYEGHAIERAAAAIAGGDVPDYDKVAQRLIEQAVKKLGKRSLREQTFGAR